MENKSTCNIVTTDSNTSYTPPKIQILEIVVEKGFADSSPSNTENFGEDTW